MSTADADSRSTINCAECDARLAHDQRYCIECGARRGPLPADVAQMMGAIHEQGPGAALPAEAALAEPLAEMGTRRQRIEFAMPGPRAAAVAVMGMLAFGVVVGSLVGGAPVESLANAPLIVVGLTQPATVASAPQAVTPPDNSGGGAPPAVTTAAAPAATQPVSQDAGSPVASPLPTTGTDTIPAGSTSGLPPVKHVFLIMLSDRGFGQSFGARSGYLSGALRRQGELVQNYYAVAPSPLANEIAVTSGQGPTAETASDCPVFSRIRPAHKGARAQVLGNGCVYPGATKTLAGQLTAAGDSWKAYLGGVNESKSACRVPKLGSKQPQAAGPHTEYLTWRNPFLYFRGLTTGNACHKNEVGLAQLAKDLKDETKTPSLAYIIPPVCQDGSEAPCKPGAATGLAGANRFLKSIVPEIKHSAAYKDAGMIAITFDQAPQSGADADPSACCNSPATYPNLRKLPPGTPAVPPGAMGTGTTSTSTTTPTGSGPTTTPTDTTTTPTDTTTTGTTTTGTTTTTTTTGTDTTSTNPADLGAGATTPTGGGGHVGLLLISPYVKANSSDVTDYFNHFSLLASIESLFGLHKLGYAGVIGLPVFGVGVFNNYAG